MPLEARVKSVPYRLDQAAADTAAAAFPRTHINVSCPHLSPSARVHGIIEAGSAERRDRLCRRALTLNYRDPVQRANRRRQSLRWREVLWRAGQQVLLYADGGKAVTLRADRNVAAGSATPIVMSFSGHPHQGCRCLSARFRRCDPAPILFPVEPDRNRETLPPVRGVGRRDVMGGDQIQVLRVRCGSTGPVV